MSNDEIDANFDMRSDANGRDPDESSKTLRRYHQLLWSKPLPNGALFELSTATPSVYLHHMSELGQFWLSSDTVIRTFKGVLRMDPIISQIPEAEREEFSRLGYTIGAMMVFPGNRIDGKWTINQARGMSPKLEDRFDLTLECIRRHYIGEDSPLSDVLKRYAEFFALFDDFRGYVDFFLLQDLVTDDYSGIRFFAPFNNFVSSPFPQSVAEYERYRALTIDFVTARNERIRGYASTL